MPRLVWFLAVLWALLIFAGVFAAIGVIIAAHEAGHYFAARALGLPVAEFVIGIGPRLIQWRRRDTIYSIRLFFLGGYVRLVTAEGDESLHEYPLLKRAVFIAGGPVASFITAYLLAVAIMMHMAIERGAGLWRTPWAGLLMVTKAAGFFFSQLLAGGLHLQGMGGVVSAGTQAIMGGVLPFLLWSFLIAFSMLLFNVLPIPALDGGRLLLLAIEWIWRRPLPRKLEMRLLIGSWVVLFLLMAAANLSDLLHA